MQTALKFFQQKEKQSKMDNNGNTEAEHQRMSQRILRNGSGRKKNKLVPCIAKHLFDEVPQSDFIFLQFFYILVHRTFIFLSKLRFGQMLISILDYYMVKIENTLDFCVPDNYEFADQKVIDKHKKLPVYDRPMAWVFFIPALIFLRILRFTLSVYCIIFGKGEITALQMQSKIISFRRYYRSIRHYAVNKWTDEVKTEISQRKKSPMWRIYYKLYEIIFMTQPRVEHHHDNDDNTVTENNSTNENNAVTEIHEDEDEDDADKAEKVEESQKLNGGVKDKTSLNVDHESDEDLNTNELIDKYAELDDSTADPEYKPAEDEIDEHSSDASDLSEAEEIEEDSVLPQKKAFDETVTIGESNANNTYSSDIERTDNDKSSPVEKKYNSDSEIQN